MFYVLLLLFYFKRDFYDDSGSYLKKASKLKYGFNEDATYYYKIISTAVGYDMVFGLATQSEMKEIENKRYYSIYCSGDYNLSRIQYYLTSETEIEGRISSKGILTPYFFTCNQDFRVTIELRIANGRNSLDYRLQSLSNFTFIYSCLTFFYIILFIMANCCLKSRFQNNSFNYLLIFILFTYLIQDIDSYLILRLQNHNEYITNMKKEYSVVLDNELSLISVCTIIFSLIFILSYSFIKYLHKKRENPTCCTFSLLIIPIICLVGMFPMMIICVGGIFSILASIFLLIFGLIVIFLPPVRNLAKLGLAFYMIGVLLACPVAYSVISLTDDHDFISNLAFLLTVVVFVVCQTLSMILFLSVFWAKSVPVDDRPIGNLESSYTVNSIITENSDNQSYQNLDNTVSPYNRNPNGNTRNPYSNIY